MIFLASTVLICFELELSITNNCWLFRTITKQKNKKKNMKLGCASFATSPFSRSLWFIYGESNLGNGVSYTNNIERPETK